MVGIEVASTMPLYEYTCPEHGTFEKLVRMAEGEIPQPCPVCEKESERIEISQTSFTLNGKWFKTTGGY